MNKYLTPKIEELFDQLEMDIDILNYEHMEIVVARLSKYYAHFDDELTDYYQYACDLLEEHNDGTKGTPFEDDEFETWEDDGQPDEFQEWYDFDPDC